MEQVKGTRLIHRRQLEDVAELIQHIQSLLPAKEAARTCVLSKSWLHAWSTSLTLRFCPFVDSLSKEQERKYMRLIFQTLQRYHREKIPITTIDLPFRVYENKTAAQESIKQVASKSSLKVLSLATLAASFTLPDEIFSSENLNTLSIKLIWPKPYYHNNSLHISSNPVIGCMNLRVLELLYVHISEEVLHKLLSTCKLLEKINLELPKPLEIIKVNNLRYLHELQIITKKCNAILEIDDVPSLRSLSYEPRAIYLSRPISFVMDTIGSLRELDLGNMYINDAFLDMIKSMFPFLESLTLEIRGCSVEILDIRCVTLQSLKIAFWEGKQIKVQVYAPKLLFYGYTGYEVPRLLFPTIAPEQIELSLTLIDPVDHLFFLKMREALKLSSKFNIAIDGVNLGVEARSNVDDVRTMVPFPATNVEELFLQRDPQVGLRENSLLFDAVFSICHPMCVKADYESRLRVANYFLKLIVNGVMEHCEIRNPLNGIWVTLTSSSLSLLDIATPRDGSNCEFKLSWCSP